MRRARLVALALALVLAAGACWFAAALVSVHRAAHHDGRRPADAIVVLGAAQYDGRPSPVLLGRLERAVELYDAGIASTVVVTGGRQPGDRFTEATASAQYLAEHGVPEASILREVQGRSSYESLSATSAFLRKRSITRVVLVSDAYHAARIVDIADEVGLKASASPVPPSAGLRSEVAREVSEAGAVSIGRIIGYRRLARILDR